MRVSTDGPIPLLPPALAAAAAITASATPAQRTVVDWPMF
jgi:hypothetical protein